MQLIQNKVRVAKEHRLGVAFFFYESLWDYAPEPKTERLARFQSLFPFPARRVAAVREWGVGSGEWGVGSGEQRRIQNSKFKIQNSKFKIQNSKPTTNYQLPT
jgi:hypothetical protein